jgi:hypothetical protein
VTLQLPNLDDRRWVDLVEDGRALIPQFAPEWTDHNIHDPGITIVELLASIAELDIYQLNQITDEHLRNFLELVGVAPRPPRPARGAVAFRLAATAFGLHVPAGVELVESEGADEPIRVRTLRALDVLPLELGAVLVGPEHDLADISARYTGRGAAIGAPPAVFRPDVTGTQALYLGFRATTPPTPGAQLHLYFAFEGPAAGLVERRRLVEEHAEAVTACPDPSDRCRPRCGGPAAEPDGPRPDDARGGARGAAPLRHHSAVTAWEYWHAAGGRWETMEAVDETRSFTLDGAVVMALPGGLAARTLDGVAEPLIYVRCRLVAGEFDVPPAIRAVVVNAVEVEQATPVWQTWTIAPSAAVSGTPPPPAGESGLRLRFGPDGRIGALEFVDAPPRLKILAFEKAPGIEGRITIEAVAAGRASGTPHLRLALGQRPVIESTFRLFSLEDDALRAWERRPDFLSSRRKDAHHLLDPTRGIVELGDGERGRVAPDGARLFAEYLVTFAALGNFPAAAPFALDDSPANRALLGDVESARLRLASVSSPVAAAGGEAAETLAHAIGRAIDERESSLRAVTLADYEMLARHTPGTRVARAAARASLRPGLGCLTAGGHVAVLIVPDSGAARPRPSDGLRRAVLRYIRRRRIIGTRVEIFGPDYVEVAVRARIAAFPRLNADEVRVRAVEGVNRFFDPMRGGPDGTGWPFGRDVYRAEILEILDRTDGVDRVESLELVVEGCERHCGNVCLPATGLVAAGRHQIEVVAT